MAEATRIGLVGGGWRAEIYLRTIAALSSSFSPVAAFCRSETSAARLQAEWGVPSTTSWRTFLTAERPDFVLVCVPPQAVRPILIQLREDGVDALCETPLGLSLDSMTELYNELGASARVQVAEQYRHQPHHAARLELVRRGFLGEVISADLSVAHDYHAVSLARSILDLSFENVRVSAWSAEDAVDAGAGEAGVPRERIPSRAERLIASISVTGTERGWTYDFSDLQYFSPLRSRQIRIRGTRGELLDDTLTMLRPDGSAVSIPLVREQTGRDGDLYGTHLRSISAGTVEAYRNGFAPARLSDDEIAMATLLHKMAEYARGGPAFYDIREAMQDQYLALLMRDAAQTGRPVASASQIWASQAVDQAPVLSEDPAGQPLRMEA